MSYNICLIPAKEQIKAELLSSQELYDRYKIEASGMTAKDALINLIAAINDDQIDTDNNYLKFYEL